MLAIAMVIVFFITSADSGAMVLNMLSSNGRDDTPLLRRVFWMAMIGVSALVLMLAGGLPALQTAAIVSALPFSVVILLSIWGFVRALSIDHAKRQTLMLTHVGPTGGSESTDWKLRLRNLLQHPAQADVNAFIQNTVLVAMRQFADELKTHGLEVRLEAGSAAQAKLSVLHGEEIDFQYSVVGRLHRTPDEAIRSDNGNDGDSYFRAEVQLNEGSQDYDVMGWTQKQVLQDILEQYEKHLHFLHVLR
jgi:choline/glycine/proline betaine transport protein